MNAVVHQVLPYRGPRDVLARMGTTAREAAETYTLREWAARLATEAAPRDYLGQLRELYRGILARWRYVREPGEWIHGSAPSLLAHVLGLKYSAPHQDPRDVDLADTPYEKGWGDCDDVATLVAAGVLALGMHAYFRVTQSEGGAHVAVVAHTPKGERVTIDPVGHPDHGFGWQLEGGRSYLYDLDGRCLRPDDAGGDEAMKTEFTGLVVSPSLRVAVTIARCPVTMPPAPACWRCRLERHG